MSFDSKRGKQLRPELELVLCCARTRIDAETSERIAELLRGKIDWADVVATAFHHQVASYLYENLRTSGNDIVPSVWLESLKQYTRESLGLAFSLLSELIRIHKTFEAEPFPLIPYKGPVLSWLAYGSLAGRTFIDLDFVTQQKNIPRATALLKSAGFTAEFGPEEELAGEAGKAPGQYGFFRAATRAHVELHTEKTMRYFPVPLDLEKLGRRQIPVEIAGCEMRTFFVEDTLVMLCVHGAKHFWDRLAWIVDIAELIAAQPVDWNLAMKIAAEMKSTRVFLLGLYLAHEQLGAVLPQPVLEKAQRDSSVRWLADFVRAQFAGNADAIPGVIPRAMFRLRSRDGIGQGVWHTLRLAMKATERDRQTVRLPGALAPLYIFARPLRLLREYGFGFRRKVDRDLAMYDPTPQEVVDRILELASVGPGDVLYDLGCGDGRIVVTAAKRFGIRAVGVEVNPRLVVEANANARREGVEAQVQFIEQDAKTVDISEATVVTIYLGADGNLRLVERLRSELRPGARVVSRKFQIYGWAPEKVEEDVMPDGSRTSLYLWRIAGTPMTGHATEFTSNPIEKLG